MGKDGTLVVQRVVPSQTLQGGGQQLAAPPCCILKHISNTMGKNEILNKHLKAVG